MKILLISGHGAGDSGAVGCGYKEAELTRTATNILDGKLKAYDVAVTRYPTSHDAYQDRRSGYMVPLTSYNLVVEVHFNSYNGKAHGTETLYRQQNCKVLAGQVTGAIASIGFANRGAKQRTDLANMNYCYRNGIPYILIETCFIDNADDMKLYHLKLYEVWDKVAAAICSHYGIKKLASGGQSVPTNKTEKPKATKLVVDGSWGKATTTMAQKVLGTYADGVVSNQPAVNKRYLPNCSTTSWQFKSSGYGAGSSLVKAIQRMVGVSADGYCGKYTVMALQKFLGVSVDGSCGNKTVSAWQKWLNSKIG